MPVPNSSGPIERINTRDIIFCTLRQWIVDGTLMPEEKISDMELANYFSTSRTPVREAIQLLSEQKLVEVVAGQGTYIAPIDKENTRQVYEMLSLLHKEAVELAGPRITEPDIAEMERLQEDFRLAIKNSNISDVQAADSLFHGYLVNKVGNQYLAQYVKQLTIQVYRVENLCFIKDMHRNQSLIAHDNILKALREGDIQKAAKFTKENWTSFYEALDLSKKLIKNT